MALSAAMGTQLRMENVRPVTFRHNCQIVAMLCGKDGKIAESLKVTTPNADVHVSRLYHTRVGMSLNPLHHEVRNLCHEPLEWRGAECAI